MFYLFLIASFGFVTATIWKTAFDCFAYDKIPSILLLIGAALASFATVVLVFWRNRPIPAKGTTWTLALADLLAAYTLWLVR